MQDLPRHLGQHSGGMVICQGRLDAVVPLENASMPGRVVVQWDKDDCADMGIVKVDLLGLGMMAVLQDALAMVNGDRHSGLGTQTQTDNLRTDAPTPSLRSRVRTSSISRICPPTIPPSTGCCSEADTIGVFQVESRAQMATLPRLQARALLRPRRRGRDHPARADRRADGASVSEAPRGATSR